MRWISLLACCLLAACSAPSTEKPDDAGTSSDHGPTTSDESGHPATDDVGAESDAPAPPPDVGEPFGEVPDAVTSAGARFAGTLGPGEDVTLDLSVFQGDRVTMWLRKANGTDWDPSINVLRPGVSEPLVYGNPQGNEDAHIPFRAGELDAGYEFWFTGTYVLELENRGQTPGDFEFTLECRGGPCAANSGDMDLDGEPDGSDSCPYYPGDCGNSPFAGNDGTLETAIRNARTSHKVLNYTEARVHMFAWIDNVDGQVEGVYTGKRVATVEIPDPAVMNTEHTWPQSRSGGDPATESDLIHLFPTDANANSERASLNYGIVVNPTWQDGGAKRGTDAGGDTRFEPRDAHKGDAARATFYYAVIYQQNIPAYEEPVLRQWHDQDPVDEKERRRNQAIFNVQGSRNPFVDFPELVDRISDF